MKVWIVGVIASLSAAVAGAAPAPDSARLARAKDFIADEQWSRAVSELQAAVDDRKEPNRDEAMFWLAESEHELGDQASAIQTIARIEQEFPASRWVRPAQSLRVEIAQRLRRDDLLWVMAAPPAPAAPAAPVPAMAAPAPRARTLMTPRPALPVIVSARPTPTPPPPSAPPAPLAPSAAAEFFWTARPAAPDTDLRIEALGGLLDDHAARVIPLLKEIALDPAQPNEARRALFVLAQSSRPEARQVVVQVAKNGPEPVQVVAIRELGRLPGPAIGSDLMQVYALTSSPSVKREVVASLGKRADSPALLRIVSNESNLLVRNTAIMTLGRVAPGPELHALYAKARPESRAAVLSALFNAKDDADLIEIARSEKDPALRRRAREQLEMLATPKALAFLAENQQ
ncbi:MAG: hypothetical protein ACRD1V_08655 [Vicinamibacterales bacterium]